MEIMNGAKKDLPNATVVLVLGILSLIFCWCYGFFGLILGIIAVVLAGGQRKLYLQSPDEYTESSFKNVNARPGVRDYFHLHCGGCGRGITFSINGNCCRHRYC